MPDLRFLLNNATPPPWRDLGDVLTVSGGLGDIEPADATLIVALVNQAHTLLDITEAARMLVATHELREYLGDDARGGGDIGFRTRTLSAALARLDQEQTP